MLLAPITLIMVEIYRKKQKMHRITSMEVSVLNEKRKYCNFKKMVCWSVLYASIISSDRTEDAHILTFILLIPCNLSGIRENFASGVLNPGPWNLGSQGIPNPVLGIRNPGRGILNPRLSRITSAPFMEGFSPIYTLSQGKTFCLVIEWRFHSLLIGKLWKRNELIN